MGEVVKKNITSVFTYYKVDRCSIKSIKKRKLFLQTVKKDKEIEKFRYLTQ